MAANQVSVCRWPHEDRREADDLLLQVDAEPNVHPHRASFECCAGVGVLWQDLRDFERHPRIQTVNKESISENHVQAV